MTPSRRPIGPVSPYNSRRFRPAIGTSPQSVHEQCILNSVTPSISRTGSGPSEFSQSSLQNRQGYGISISPDLSDPRLSILAGRKEFMLPCTDVSTCRAMKATFTQDQLIEFQQLETLQGTTVVWVRQCRNCLFPYAEGQAHGFGDTSRRLGNIASFWDEHCAAPWRILRLHEQLSLLRT